MAKRVCYENLVDPNAVFRFPKDFAEQIKDHERRMSKTSKSPTESVANVSTSTKEVDPLGDQALMFYDIDDLEVIPFDSVEI